MARTAPDFSRLLNALSEYYSFSTTVYAEVGQVVKVVEVAWDCQLEYVGVYLYEGKRIGSRQPELFRADSLPAAFERLEQELGEATLYADTGLVNCDGHPVACDNPLYKLVDAIWCSLRSARFDLGNDDRLAARALVLKENLAAVLQCGAAAVSEWNARSDCFKQEVSFANSQLDGLNLAEIDMRGLDFAASVFDGADLSGAWLYQTKLTGSSFIGSRLKKADLTAAHADDVDFTKANLNRANLQYTLLNRSILKDANLAHANLDSAKLIGTDLSKCELKGATFRQADFDESTRFPDVFPQWQQLTWVGEGENPLVHSCNEVIASVELVDFDQLLDLLSHHVEPARLASVFKMLKNDSFQLFSDREEESITGVVKSQTDEKLVYACRLSIDGSYSCCTQNLRGCGGLRESICKHILVLVLGLVQNEVVSPTRAARWLLATKLSYPDNSDKESISSILLKYKGAEAGEIDWRPTETLPEDFYAY